PKVDIAHLEIGSEQGQRRYVRLANSLRKSLRGLVTVLAGRYDLLHCNTALDRPSITRDLAMVFAARLRQKGVLLHIHGGRFLEARPGRVLRWVIGLLMRLSAKVAVLSERERSILVANYPESADHVAVIRNGVNVCCLPQRDDAGAGFKIMFVGRIAESKGIVPLLRACSGLASGVTVTLYGRGPLLDDVHRVASENKQVRYGGIFDTREAQSIASRYDALILPSLWGEGMPMAILEAMSVGTVPVCTALGSIPEIVQDGATGLLIAPEPEAICKAIEMLSASPDLRKRLSEAAKNYALANLCASKNYGQLIPVYQQLVGS
ncbi:MAG: glycosyltransferase family 4 protein, partial [Minisyncoccia bacterium]